MKNKKRNIKELPQEKSLQKPLLLQMNLQLFAGNPINIYQIAEIPEEGDPKYLFSPFTEPEGEVAEVADTGDDNDEIEVEIIPEDPVLFPRLAVTDQNLLYTAIGETVIRNMDGELSTAAVDEDGTVTETTFQIGAENIEEGCITGSKLEEGTITSRELDMSEIFADATVLNQMLAANIDTEGMFNNETFLNQLDVRVVDTCPFAFRETAD